jgi:hypothetical protein
MANSLDDFKKKVAGSPALKAMLLGESLATLQKHGVDIHDAAVAKSLGLDKPIDLSKINSAASSAIITITA